MLSSGGADRRPGTTSGDPAPLAAMWTRDICQGGHNKNLNRSSVAVTWTAQYILILAGVEGEEARGEERIPGQPKTHVTPT